MVLILGLFSAPVGASDECSKLLSSRVFTTHTSSDFKKIDKAFRELYFESCDYISGRCNQNVLFLFLDLKLRVPALNVSDFKVLYVAPPNWKRADRPLQQMAVKNYRDAHYSETPEQPLLWNFHVLLTYKGRAYDLDYGDMPNPVPLKDLLSDPNYLQEHIVLNDGESDYILTKDEFLIYEIPGESFLYLNADLVGSAGFSTALVENIAGQTLKNYLDNL